MRQGPRSLCLPHSPAAISLWMLVAAVAAALSFGLSEMPARPHSGQSTAVCLEGAWLSLSLCLCLSVSLLLSLSAS